MDDIYDVIIVGAGPAGGTAAYFLGEAGWRVLVLEKETLPRYKSCGGGLSARFLEKQFPFSFDPILQTEVDSFRYDFSGRSVTIPVRPGVVGMVMRDQFDAYLLSHTKAEVRQGVAVKNILASNGQVLVETRQGQRFAGRYLIGADGANSIVARSLGMRQNRTLAAAIEVETPASPDAMARFGRQTVFIFGEIRLGYLWIFPKPDHLSVGIAALRPRRGELQATLKRVMARYGLSIDDLPLHGHPIPIYTGRQQIATQRVLLVGDAAGLADPLSGEGIRYAIKSARLASQALLSGHPEHYQGLVFRYIGLNHTFALLVGQFFYYFQHTCLRLGAPNPFTTQAIVDLLSDQASTADVMLRAILTLPVYLLTETVAALLGRITSPAQRERLRAAVYNRGEVRAPGSG